MVFLEEALMARNTSVSLGDHFATFIDAQVQAGRYGSASDVVRAGLRFSRSMKPRCRPCGQRSSRGRNRRRPPSISMPSLPANARPSLDDGLCPIALQHRPTSRTSGTTRRKNGAWSRRNAMFSASGMLAAIWPTHTRQSSGGRYPRGYRKAAAGSHILFFRVTDAGLLDVVRILHQRMDISRHL